MCPWRSRTGKNILVWMWDDSQSPMCLNTWCGCWDSSLGPLEEQQMLWTTESSLAFALCFLTTDSTWQAAPSPIRLAFPPWQTAPFRNCKAKALPYLRSSFSGIPPEHQEKQSSNSHASLIILQHNASKYLFLYLGHWDTMPTSSGYKIVN